MPQIVEPDVRHTLTLEDSIESPRDVSWVNWFAIQIAENKAWLAQTKPTAWNCWMRLALRPARRAAALGDRLTGLSGIGCLGLINNLILMFQYVQQSLIYNNFSKLMARLAQSSLGHSSVAFTIDPYSHIIERMQSDVMVVFDEGIATRQEWRV